MLRLAHKHGLNLFSSFMTLTLQLYIVCFKHVRYWTLSNTIKIQSGTWFMIDYAWKTFIYLTYHFFGLSLYCYKTPCFFSPIPSCGPHQGGGPLSVSGPPLIRLCSFRQTSLVLTCLIVSLLFNHLHMIINKLNIYTLYM